MDKKQWQEHYGIHDIDMELIEAVVNEGGMATGVDRDKLDYETIAFNK